MSADILHDTTMIELEAIYSYSLLLDIVQNTGQPAAAACDACDASTSTYTLTETLSEHTKTAAIIGFRSRVYWVRAANALVEMVVHRTYIVTDSK